MARAIYVPTAEQREKLLVAVALNKLNGYPWEGRWLMDVGQGQYVEIFVKSDGTTTWTIGP